MYKLKADDVGSSADSFDPDKKKKLAESILSAGQAYKEGAARASNVGSVEDASQLSAAKNKIQEQLQKRRREGALKLA